MGRRSKQPQTIVAPVSSRKQLLGKSAVCTFLGGISTDSLDKLRNDAAERFPAPIQMLGNTPMWTVDQLERYVSRIGRPAGPVPAVVGEAAPPDEDLADQVGLTAFIVGRLRDKGVALDPAGLLRERSAVLGATRHAVPFTRDYPPCIYFLKRGGRVVYVGQTTRLNLRLCWHLADGKDFDAIEYVPVPSALLDAAEQWFISLHRPDLNRRGLDVAAPESGEEVS